MVALVVLLAPAPFIQHYLGWPYAAAYDLLTVTIIALLQIRRIHRRGHTVPEAIASGRSDWRHQAHLQERARQAAVALPWLSDRRLSADAVPGVLVAPAPHLPGHRLSGHDVVLDSAGSQPMRVIKQVRRLTRLSLKDAKGLVDSAPVTVLQVPDLTMADAARSILESAGAAVSIGHAAS